LNNHEDKVKMKHLLKVLRALSDPNRLRIIQMLRHRPLCVCEITEILQLATSTVSKHLSILREATLITDLRDGKWVNYEPTATADPQIQALLALIAEWLADDKRVLEDQTRVSTVSRDIICGLDR